MSKLYICGLCNGTSDVNDLKELLEPIIPYYDGLQWVVHNPIVLGGAYTYLDSIKKDGKIICTDWCYRLNFSRNHYLYQGQMKIGDWFISLDPLEILRPQFFEKWPQLKQALESNHIDGVLLYGKRFLYKFNDFLEHKGNPHEYISGANRVVELTSIDGYKDTSWFWGTNRNQKRDKFHYIWHFVNYYVNFPDSNHCLLGIDNLIDREEIFRKRESLRQMFRNFCRTKDCLPLSIDGFKYLWYNFSNDMKYFINNERILNDAYLYFILKDELSLSNRDSSANSNPLEILRLI